MYVARNVLPLLCPGHGMASKVSPSFSSIDGSNKDTNVLRSRVADMVRTPLPAHHVPSVSLLVKPIFAVCVVMFPTPSQFSTQHDARRRKNKPTARSRDCRLSVRCVSVTVRVWAFRCCLLLIQMHVGHVAVGSSLPVQVSESNYRRDPVSKVSLLTLDMEKSIDFYQDVSRNR